MPLAMMLIWMQLSQSGDVGGYRVSDFAIYFMSIYFVRQITSIWVIPILDRCIRQGELNLILLRPFPPVQQHMAEHIGEMLLRGPIILCVFLAGLWLTDTIGLLNLTNTVLFLVSTLCAWVIIFNLYYCVGLLAFWTENSLAYDPLLWSLYTILGGSVIPIDLFPSSIAGILRLLPFSSTLDFPAQIMLGQISNAEIALGFAMQAFWMFASTMCRNALWRKGLTKYSGAGI